MVAVHGHKFYRDQKIRAGLPAAILSIDAEPNLLQALTSRGIVENQAKRLLKAIAPDQPVLDQIEYADYLIAQANRSIANPPGFYVYVLREDVRRQRTSKPRQNDARENTKIRQKHTNNCNISPSSRNTSSTAKTRCMHEPPRYLAWNSMLYSTRRSSS